MNMLRALNVSEHVEKKGKFNYLSWAWAVDQLIEKHPKATWEVKHFPMMIWETVNSVEEHHKEPYALTDTVGSEVSAGTVGVTKHRDIKNLRACPDMKVPYMRTDCGYFVEVGVTVDGVERTQVHPVLNHQNKPIDHPNSFEINTAIQRCLAKAIALHGLGLYIYAGEDLPPEEKGQITGEPINQAKVDAAVYDLKKLMDKDGLEHAPNIKVIWHNLTVDEQLKVNEALNETAPDSRKKYKNILKEYLSHEEVK